MKENTKFLPNFLPFSTQKLRTLFIHKKNAYRSAAGDFVFKQLKIHPVKPQTFVFVTLERFCSTRSRVKTRTWFVTRRYVKFWFCNTLLRFSLTWNPNTPGAGLAPTYTSKQRKVCASHPRVPKSKRWGSRLTTKWPRWEKNRLRRETVARPLVTWFTYQDNVENRDHASEATFVRFLREDNVLQNLAIVKSSVVGKRIKNIKSWVQQLRCPTWNSVLIFCLPGMTLC